MKARIYSANANGTPTQVKAYKKRNAIARLKQLDENIKSSDVKSIIAFNSHQAPVEELYPEICK